MLEEHRYVRAWHDDITKPGISCPHYMLISHLPPQQVKAKVTSLLPSVSHHWTSEGHLQIYFSSRPRSRQKKILSVRRKSAHSCNVKKTSVSFVQKIQTPATFSFKVLPRLFRTFSSLENESSEQKTTDRPPAQHTHTHTHTHKCPLR